MAAVWLSRFSRAYEALVNAKGGPVVDDIDPTLKIVALIQEGNEDRYLQGWNRFGVTIPISAGGAGLNGVGRLRNPAGSNVVAVIESVVAFNSTGADSPFVTWGATVTDFTTIVSTAFSRIDPRGNPTPTSIISSQAVAPGANFNQANFPANGQAQFVPTVNCEYPVLPGQIFQCQSNLANSIFTVSFLWRERALQQSELT